MHFAHYDPEPDRPQLKRLLASRNPPVRAVLTGGLDNPRVTGAVTADFMPWSASADRFRRPYPAAVPPESARDRNCGFVGVTRKDQGVTAQIGQMLLFFLTLLLSGMVMSQLIEEKSNKIIEVIAAAVPIDALFIGKLFAMLAASVAGIIVWISSGVSSSR